MLSSSSNRRKQIKRGQYHSLSINICRVVIILVEVEVIKFNNLVAFRRDK